MVGLSLHGWENTMVVALIVAGAFAFVAGAATWAVVKLQRVELAQSADELERYKTTARAELGTAQADIAKANAQIAEATARQKEAELKLEQIRKQVGQRSIDFEHFLKALEGKPKAPVEILFPRENGEAFNLALELRNALRKAQWTVSEPTPIPPTIIPGLENTPTAMAAGGQPTGLTVAAHEITHDEADAMTDAVSNRPNITMTSFLALYNALLATIGSLSAHGGGVAAPPKGTLRIIVGPKP